MTRVRDAPTIHRVDLPAQAAPRLIAVGVRDLATDEAAVR
jgi:hypothetical protein